MFYLLTRKQVVIQYKMWNQVMVWFTQMMCCNVYIPLLIRQANDVDVLITVKEMKHSSVKMLVSNV